MDPLEKTTQESWDGHVVEYDAKRFCFDQLVLDEIRSAGYRVDDLSEIDQVVPNDEVYELSRLLCESTRKPEFKQLIDDLVGEVVVPEGQLVPPISVQRQINVRIFLPNKPAATFPFHTGRLYGHGRASRSIWMPLTDVRSPEMKTASMQIIDAVKSRKLVSRAIEERLSISAMNELFGRFSRQCQAGPGAMVFFSQDNLHGNFVNETGKTRVSLDFRVAEEKFGQLLARKIPGGYFRLHNNEPQIDSKENDLDGEQKWVVYLSNNTQAVYGIPVHLQRLAVEAFCKTSNMKSHFEFFELEGMDHLPTLFHIIDKAESCVLLYSIFALPECVERRQSLYEALESRRVILHFVNENMTIHDWKSSREVESTLGFAGHGLPGNVVGLPSSK